MGFGAGALTMLIMGKSFFIKPRFFFGVLAANAMMAATGYAISMKKYAVAGSVPPGPTDCKRKASQF